MIAVWRAVQLGIIPSERVTDSISAIEQGILPAVPLDVDLLLEKVREELPMFGRNKADTAAGKDTATP
jgi:hypothetical protein